jgi:uncharacterized membrane protein
MAHIERSIEVECPIRTVYNQWTQFESFPKFMHGVERVDQKKDDLVHFVVRIAGHRMEYDAEIVAQKPDRCIEWRSTTGRETGGVVSFERVDDKHTRVTLRLNYDPEGVLEKVGDLANVVGMQAKNDLTRFKEFIESSQHEEGAWRGKIEKS